ncbi:uncharacterized protein F5Z01DRAFT_635700 [Emericellopsis atlantica]|uniref:Clock-controlled protein 6 n=1 Tax=Emericellopsis atlantica TaxID=2614577 RepID=A0A9P7ZNL3_9HYPO|nr:uncharacterized protein F5Z01DRAFT_635700 [Emericellopsis atlantica]KAG9255428.1 hypothetical protein F5Z01DRAFT_635700 [Emericellopsis atlantica]
MKFTAATLALAGAAAVQANTGVEDVKTPVATVTVVTTDYEVYCPGPTTFIHKNATYTATTETTITITNCPCTITTVLPPAVTTTVSGEPGEESGVPTVIQPPPVTSIIDITPVPGTPGVPTNVPTGPSGVPVPSDIPVGAGVKKTVAGVGALVVAGAAYFVL